MAKPGLESEEDRSLAVVQPLQMDWEELPDLKVKPFKARCRAEMIAMKSKRLLKMETAILRGC